MHDGLKKSGSCRPIGRQGATAQGALNQMPNLPPHEIIDQLSAALRDHYVCVSPERNPIALELPKLNIRQTEHVVLQYAFFPCRIVPLLLLGRDVARKAGWTEVANELTRNLGEELGTETNGEPHSELLMRGLESALGLSPRTTDLQPATRTFLQTMNAIMPPTVLDHEPGLPTVATIVGAAYALEASAIPELEIVWSLILHFIDLRPSLRGEESLSLLEWFFDEHKNHWEYEHHQCLNKAVRGWIEDEPAAAHFRLGFHQVMRAMDRWWRELHIEISKLGEDTSTVVDLHYAH